MADHATRQPQWRAGLAHVGAGAFHRCHQADFTQDMLESGDDHRTITAINLRPPALGGILAPQDCLYTRTLCEDGDRDTRLITAISEVLDLATDRARIERQLANRDIQTVTLTVTEKGYCHVPATGQLDPSNADIQHDLRNPETAMSAPGFLCHVLSLRKANGAGGMNLVSCDNIPSNGAVLRNCVLSFARQRSPELAAWIEDNCRFPCTAVDRIVPATTADDIIGLEAEIGLRDEAAVFGEPFRQWVLDHEFIGDRPRWDAAGAVFVKNVKNHELVKMRVLNAAQTMLALLGCHAGLNYTHEATRRPDIAAFVNRTLLLETLPGIPLVPGMEGGAYLAKSFERIGNTAVRHRNHQIATDTSQKIRQRLLDPIRENFAAGRPVAGLCLAVAAWFAYLARAGAAFGARWEVSDPVAEEAARHVAASGEDIERLAASLLSMTHVFGDDLPANASFVSNVKWQTRLLLTEPLARSMATPMGELAEAHR